MVGIWMKKEKSEDLYVGESEGYKENGATAS
jgi:hypothetical protein